MKREQFKLSLGTHIGLTLMLLIFVVIGVMSGILYNHFRQSARTSIHSAIDAAVSANSREIQARMERIQTAVDLINENGHIFLKRADAQEELAGLVCNYGEQSETENLYGMVKLYNEWETKCDEYFQYCFSEGFDYYCKIYIAPEYPITKWLSKIDEFGVASSGNKEVGILSGESVEEEAWYQQAIRLGGQPLWFMLDQYPDRLCMAKQLTFSYLEAGTMQVKTEGFAVLGLWFDINWIMQSVNTAAVTENANVWLMDSQNNIIYADEETIAREFSAFDRLIESETVNCLIGDEEYLAQKKELNENLYMVTIVPANDVANMSFSIVKIIFWVAIAMMCVGACLSITLGIYVVKPIKFLADHMNTGRLQTIESRKAKGSEVTVLYRSFNSLVEHSKELMANLIVTSEKRKLAEIHALQAQINPHFIYNTLNAIASLEMISGRREVARILNSLSQIMRYNIKDPDRMVTLEEELQSILYYVEIQQFCSSKPFTCEYDIAPSETKYRLPKVIIQPLIENSLIHGNQMTEGNGKIRLSVFPEDDKLCIRVWDNGTCADVMWINMYIRGNADVERYTDSLGIRNVYERIRMVYGDEADLIFSQDEEECTVATIYLPYDQETQRAK